MDRETIYRFLTKAFPNEGSEEVRQQRILDFMKRASPTTMSSEVEQTIMKTIENPHLVLTDDVRVYRDHIQQNGHTVQQADLPKSCARAAELRSDGNLWYAKKEYVNALERYNASICSAPNDSEDLGIGYANRSAVYCERGDYILALANISLAKEHNYPARLMHKLMAREANCKQAIENLGPKPNAIMPSGSERKHFLSDRVCVRKLPVYNNSLVASQDFKAGDVILQEKPLMVTFHNSSIFARCNHCRAEDLLHLIPCPNCVSAMFCSENCLQDGQQLHRFECGVTGGLSKLEDGWLGARMFLHGLSLFEDDVNKMMAFCQKVKPSECSFLDMDYSNFDPMKEFEIFLAVKPTDFLPWNCAIRLSAAIAHSVLLNVSSVRALITNRAQEDFMLQCFVEYMHKAATMSIQRNSNGGLLTTLYPLASLCNHSCDPNSLALEYGGQLKMVALRPIRRGEQILISYGAHFKHDANERRLELMALGFACICDVCDEQKHQKLMAKANNKGAVIAPKDWATINTLMTDAAFNQADRKNALQQFLQRYASIHPRQEYAVIVQTYRNYLTDAHVLEMNAAMLAKISV